MSETTPLTVKEISVKPDPNLSVNPAEVKKRYGVLALLLLKCPQLPKCCCILFVVTILAVSVVVGVRLEAAPSPPTLVSTPHPTTQMTPHPTMQMTPHPTMKMTPHPVIPMTPHPTMKMTPHPVIPMTPHPTMKMTPHPTHPPM